MGTRLPSLLFVVFCAILTLTLYTRRTTVLLNLRGTTPQPVAEPLLPPEAELCRQSIQDNNTEWSTNVRIGKCTALFGKQRPMYERARRTHEMHNQIHGIVPLVLRDKLVDDLWNKPAFILSVLLDEMKKREDDRLEWLLWVDRDTIVLNPCVPAQAFLPPEEEKDVHMVATKDWNGLNNGIFLVRVNQWSIELFSDILAFRYYRPDEDLQFTEQSAMAKLLDESKFKDNTVYVPQRWFNAYQGRDDQALEPYHTRRGDFLVHFAGVGERSKEMEYWLEVAERHAPDWMLEFGRTSYPGEIEEFWRHHADEE